MKKGRKNQGEAIKKKEVTYSQAHPSSSSQNLVLDFQFVTLKSVAVVEPQLQMEMRWAEPSCDDSDLCLITGRVSICFLYVLSQRNPQ